jgi:hypothetical protein
MIWMGEEQESLSGKKEQKNRKQVDGQTKVAYTTHRQIGVTQ